jgi:hypothetical protein
LQAWLCNIEALGESLTFHQKGEIVAAIVRVMHLTNLNGIVSQEVVDDVWEVIEATVETQNTTIVVEELFLALHAATAQRLFHIFFQTGIT